MNQRRIRQIGSTVAAITTVVYFWLVCLASTCSLTLPIPVASGGHEHHDQDATQSSLCAWACQVTSEGGLVASAPAELPGLVSIASVVPHIDPLSASPSPLLQSRAPPMFTLG
jgi:hypothetical protein